MDALFALKTEVAIGDLHGDGDEDGVAGHAKKIRSIVHVNFIVDDSRADFFFEIPEALRRTLDAKVAIDHIELVGARRSRAERNGAGCSIGVGEAARFGRRTHDFGQTRACTGNMRERVFLARISRDVIFAGTGGINEFDFDVLADPFEMAIAPQLPGIRGRGAAALLGSAVVSAAGGVRLNLIGRTPNDVNVAAIRFPARDPGGEVFVGVGEAAVVLLPHWINGRFGVWIAVAPEDLLVLFALFFRAEFEKSTALFVGNDVGNDIPKPVVSLRAQFLGEFPVALLNYLGALRLCRTFLWDGLVLGGGG